MVVQRSDTCMISIDILFGWRHERIVLHVVFCNFDLFFYFFYFFLSVLVWSVCLVKACFFHETRQIVKMAFVLLSQMCIARSSSVCAPALVTQQQRFVNHKRSMNHALAKKSGKRKSFLNPHYYPPPGSPARQFWVDWVIEPGTDKLYVLPPELEDKIKRLTRTKRLVTEQASDRFRLPRTDSTDSDQTAVDPATQSQS